MSSTKTPGQSPTRPEAGTGTTKGKEFVNRIGLPTAGAFVIGSIIGSATVTVAVTIAAVPHGTGN